MKLVPVTENQLDCLRGPVQARLEEANLTDRTNVDLVLKAIRTTYASRCAGVYVDDVENPRRVLVMAHYPGSDLMGLQAFVSMLWIDPELRGDIGEAKEMLGYAENYARLNGCAHLVGSSWTYRGAKPIAPLFVASGFEPQETIYIKHL
jgi:hypothetical protein